MKQIPYKMREADVTGLDVDTVSLRTNRDTLEKDVLAVRLQNDAKLREIYQFGRKLGQGSFGVVYEATHIETQTKWAIKEVCRLAAGSLQVKMLEQEINIVKQVNHDCIIQLKEVYNTGNMIYLVIELCTGGELNQLLQWTKYFTEDETRHIICSLAEAVVYLHRRDIVHRDWKLENILRMMMAGLISSYSQWRDVWSIGGVMYIMMASSSKTSKKTGQKPQ